jgi:hypothetical protein
MTAENNPRSTSVSIWTSYILNQVPIDVRVRLQHAIGFKSFREPLMYLERWDSYTGADEDSNVLEYYAVSTGNSSEIKLKKSSSWTA